MKYYIKERHNPQLKAPYYVAMGQLPAKDAKHAENALFGTNYVLGFDTEEAYKQRLAELRAAGATIHDR